MKVSKKTCLCLTTDPGWKGSRERALFSLIYTVIACMCEWAQTCDGMGLQVILQTSQLTH